MHLMNFKNLVVFLAFGSAVQARWDRQNFLHSPTSDEIPNRK